MCDLIFANEQYLSPSLNFYKQARSNTNGSVLACLIYRFCFLVLCCLACFSNTRLTLPFALRVASAPTPVSLWLGNGVVGLKYWRIPVLNLKKKKKGRKQLLKNNGPYSAILHKARNIHYCCFSWNS